MTITCKSSSSNETLNFVGNCNCYDQLLTGHHVIRFSLLSYSWLKDWTPLSPINKNNNNNNNNDADDDHGNGNNDDDDENEDNDNVNDNEHLRVHIKKSSVQC